MPREGFRAALSSPEFRAMWAAEGLSQTGDQIARVALSLLVFDHTQSPLWTAVTYALTSVPTMIGGALLGGLADRFARRTVMVVCDVVRALLLLVMVLPGMPLWLLVALVATLTLFGGPFRAAQLALLPEVLPGERYTAGLAVRTITISTAQLVGFAGGGLLVAATGPRWGLGIDAATFAVSALFLLIGVRVRPAPSAAGERQPTTLQYAVAGFQLCWRDRGLRTLIGLSALAGFYVAPEGLAAPYASALGLPDSAVGWLLAADPVGAAIAGWLVGRYGSDRRQLGWIAPAALLTGVPLIVCGAQPGLVGSLVLFALAGAVAVVSQVPLSAAISRGAPAAQRASVMGLWATVLVASQGLGIALFGAVAQGVGPVWSIVIAGLAGIAVGVPLAISWSRTVRVTTPRWLTASG